MPQLVDLTGREFGRLRVVGRDTSRRTVYSRWTCHCAPDLGGCGRQTTVAVHNLNSGNTISCGCALRESASRTGRLRFTKTCVTCGREYAGSNRQKYCGLACRPQYRPVTAEVPPVIDYTLLRTGDSPLSFCGELIASARSQANRGPAESRWYELDIYRTVGGSYVVAVVFRSRWQGELHRHVVRTFGNPAEVRGYLRNYDPCAPGLWTGIPPGVNDAGHRNNLVRSAVAGAFHEAVSRVLAGTEFAEVVA